MKKKVVQVGRSRLQEEMANPTWSSRGSSAKSGSKPSSERRVQKVEAAPVEKKKLRVASYCRVSTDFEEQESSIEAQRSHYAAYIQSNPDWELVDIYWEQGLSGTKAETRPELQRLLSDCRKGLIDLVITKSISRFSRNTSDCLEMVRSLGSLGVRIIFEKEGIDTGRMESELLLTLLSAFAENESRSLSANMKWGIRKRFEAGTYKSSRAPYGYRKTENGPRPGYVIDPVESETVRRIFYSFLEGKGADTIAGELNAEGVPTFWDREQAIRPRDGEERQREKAQGCADPGEDEVEEKGRWFPDFIRKIIKNPFYVGDCIYQKTFVDDNFKQQPNRGELDMYVKEDDHEAIISREVFELANQMLARHAEELGSVFRRNRYCFSGKLICGNCGGGMNREGAALRPFFLCCNHKHGSCPMMPQFVQDVKNAFTTVLNKLAWGEANGVPVLGGYLDAGDEEEKERIKKDMEVVEKRQALLHDRVMAERFTAELRAKKAALDAEMVALKGKLEKLGHREDVHRLRKAVMERGIVDQFTPDITAEEVAGALTSAGLMDGERYARKTDSEIFAEHVDKAVVWSRDRIEFHFTCGLVLTESLAIPIGSADEDGGGNNSEEVEM